MTTKTTLLVLMQFLLGIGLGSCKTYSLSVDSFKKQFTKKPNSIDSIKCTDKKGNLVAFENSPSFEIHITDFTDQKFIFNAQAVRVINDTVIGWKTQENEVAFQSMPLPALQTLYSTNRKVIPLTSIKKVVLIK